MERNGADFGPIDDYIGSFPPGVQKKLRQMRETIRAAAPDAEEKISYRMPAFALKGILVYFAAFRNHIGFYPTSSGIRKFRRELSVYKWGKGSVQFPLDTPLPLGLVHRIVKYRVAENERKAREKIAGKKTEP